MGYKLVPLCCPRTFDELAKFLDLFNLRWSSFISFSYSENNFLLYHENVLILSLIHTS